MWRRLPGLLLSGATKSVAVLALLLLWELAPRFELVDRTFLPPFSEVLDAWYGLLRNGQLADNTVASLTRSLSGFGLAVVIGVPGWREAAQQRLDRLLLQPLRGEPPPVPVDGPEPLRPGRS